MTMKLRKGMQLRLALQEEPVTFVRLGYPEHPHSRQWATVQGPDGERAVSIDSLYPDGPEWAEWLRVYQETSEETRIERTCPTCGQADNNRVEYGGHASRERARRLEAAHNKAIRAAGRIPFADRYGRSIYGAETDYSNPRADDFDPKAAQEAGF